MSGAVDLVLAADPNALVGLAVTVRSALENCSRACNVHVISVGLSEDEKFVLGESWVTPRTRRVEFLDLDQNRLARFRATLQLRSKAAYARLYISELLPHLSRCLYFDTDLLVVSDFAELYDTTMGDAVVAAARDISVRNGIPKGYLPGLQLRLGLTNPRRYFNSGVLVMNLEAWRSRDIGPKSQKVALDRYDHLHALDQDVLNMVLHEQWIEVDPRWNRSQYELAAAPAEGIVHLIGTVKPWHPDYHYHFRDRFFEILDRTMLAGWRPSDPMGLGTLGTRVRRCIPSWEMVTGKVRRLLNGVR